MTRLLLIGLLVFAAIARAEPEVRLPLAEFDHLKEELKRAEPEEEKVVVDLLRLTGSFRKHDLGIELTGHASGHHPTAVVLSGTPSLRLHDCAGDGLVTRDSEGFRISPATGRFQIRCRIESESAETLEITTTAAAQWADANVVDGELTVSHAGDGGLTLRLTPILPEEHTILPPTAVAYYRIRLLPGGTRFSYSFNVHNPNRGRTPFELNFQSGEQIQQFGAVAPKEVSSSRYVFDLPPGDSTITVSGTLPGGQLQSPVKAGLTYLLLEPDPILRAEVQGAPSRISIGEVGMTTNSPGAMAFLLKEGEALRWTSTRLEAMSVPGFAVPDAAHTFYVSRDAEVVGETALHFDNRGASELVVPMQARPTFASLPDGPVQLTRNPDGHLSLPLAPGSQWIDMQFRSALRKGFGFAWGRLWLPQLQTPSSQSQIDARYSPEWVPLFERFQYDVRWGYLDPSRLLWSLATTLGSILAIRLHGVRRRRCGALFVLLAPAAFASNFVVWLLVGGTLWLASRQLLGRLPSAGYWRQLALGLLSGVVVLAVARSEPRPAVHTAPPYVTAPTASSDRLVPKPSTETCNGFDDDCDTAQDNYAGASTPLTNGLGWWTPKETTYRGLPARMQLPIGRWMTTFNAQMLSTGAPTGVQVLLVRRQILWFASSGLTLLVLLVLLREWRRLSRSSASI